MLVAFFRTLILYLTIIFGVRLMGKRQLGELQPSELVITIIISNIATLPIEEIDTPLFMGLLPILTLVAFEVIVSSVNLRCRATRKLFSGTPAVVIRGGIIDQRKLQELRFSVDDLMSQLRSNQIFSPEDVDFAMVETTGKLFDLENLISLRQLLPDQPAQNSPPLIIISDGVLYSDMLSLIGRDAAWVKEVLASYKLSSVNEVFIMTADKNGKCLVIKKEGAA